MKIVFFTLLVTLFSTSYAKDSRPFKTDLKAELNEAELKSVNSREFVIKTEEVQGSPWPEITYYAVIESTALESIGIFAAYDIQKDYVPNIIKSTVSKNVSPTDIITDYELHLPFPLSNARYSHGARLYRFGEDYALEWYMLESTSSEEVRGSAYFSPYNGKTLFRYRSYVKPKSMLGSFVKKAMMKDVNESIVAIRNFIEKNKREQSAINSKYSEFITRSLRGEFVYQTNVDKK